MDEVQEASLIIYIYKKGIHMQRALQQQDQAQQTVHKSLSSLQVSRHTLACQMRKRSPLMLLRITRARRIVESFCNVMVIRWDTILAAVNLIKHWGDPRPSRVHT